MQHCKKKKILIKTLNSLCCRLTVAVGSRESLAKNSMTGEVLVQVDGGFFFSFNAINKV